MVLLAQMLGLGDAPGVDPNAGTVLARSDVYLHEYDRLSRHLDTFITARLSAFGAGLAFVGGIVSSDVSVFVQPFALMFVTLVLATVTGAFTEAIYIFIVRLADIDAEASGTAAQRPHVGISSIWLEYIQLGDDAVESSGRFAEPTRGTRAWLRSAMVMTFYLPAHLLNAFCVVYSITMIATTWDRQLHSEILALPNWLVEPRGAVSLVAAGAMLVTFVWNALLIQWRLNPAYFVRSVQARWNRAKAATELRDSRAGGGAAA